MNSSLLSVSAMAIGDSPTKRLKLCQIYDYIKERFPYYRVRKKHISQSLVSNLRFYFRVRTVKAGRTLFVTTCLSMNVLSRCRVKVALRGKEIIGC